MYNVPRAKTVTCGLEQTISYIIGDKKSKDDPNISFEKYKLKKYFPLSSQPRHKDKQKSEIRTTSFRIWEFFSPI